jgi:hypothetical protein
VPITADHCPRCGQAFQSNIRPAPPPPPSRYVRRTPVTASDTGRYEGFFGPERKGVDKGVIGGILMMVIAAVWFFVGLSAGILFYYPPILFIIGLYAFFKGLFTGNISGE